MATRTILPGPSLALAALRQLADRQLADAQSRIEAARSSILKKALALVTGAALAGGVASLIVFV